MTRKRPIRWRQLPLDGVKDEIDELLHGIPHEGKREETAADLVEYINLHYRGGKS